MASNVLNNAQLMRHLAALSGSSAVALFFAAIAVFGTLDSDFRVLDDYISELGALGKPYGLWWNLTGFLSVGLLLTVFGFTYGRVINDRLVGILLTLFGLGFAMTAVPVEDGNSTSTLSTAHILAICLGLAAWMIALARLAHLTTTERDVRLAANIAAGLFLIPFAGQVFEWWAMPLTHRLVFAVVFGWFAWTAGRLLVADR